MFKNIGKKIKGWTKFCVVFNMILNIIAGIVVIVLAIGSDNVLLYFVGLSVIVFGSILSWISGFMMYGFGELVDNSQIIREYIEREEN